MSIPNDKMDELRKQAFFDSHLSRQANINKYKYSSDPILQEKENYVSNYIFNN
jgi:hypothetical protein